MKRENILSDGFLNQSAIQAVRQPLTLIPKCGACGLYKHCQSPKMPVSGQGKRRILLLGETGGRNEDRENRQFVGASGQELEKSLAKFGINMRLDCWLTNAVICRPHDAEGNNRTPTPKEIEWCRPTVVKTIKELKPDVIIPLGGTAVKSLLGWLWKEDVGNISRWDGWRIPCQKINSWICPTWHPASLLHDGSRNGEDQRGARENEVRRLLFEKHLKRASKLKGKPWPDGPPNYASMVEVVWDDARAAKAIGEFAEAGKVCAFDYENSPLKPYVESRRIVCCSISDGDRTISYPWTGKAIKATKRFLESDVPKVCSNVKHELLWSFKVFGVWVKNVAFDTMIAAHVLDNREGITSIKFQAFMNLGQESWDDHIKPWLKSKKGGENDHNRIHELDLGKLCQYCGLDSLMEILVAKIQAKQIGWDLD